MYILRTSKNASKPNLEKRNYHSHEASMMRKRSHAQTVKLIAIAVEN